MRDSQIREIVRRRESDFQNQGKIPAHYLEQVFQRSDILQLHRNPLLLTLSMGVYLHQPSNDIPHKLAEFYQQAIDNLLLRHHFQKTQDKPANLFDKDDKLHLLQEFALQNLLQATDDGRDFETFPFNAIVTTGEALAKQGVVNFKPEQARDALCFSDPFYLFNGHGFCKITGLIYVPAVEHGDLVGKKLKWNNGKKRREDLWNFGDREKIVGHFF